MQGYGPAGRRIGTGLARSAAVLTGVLLLVGTAGCSLLTEEGRPTAIEIPGTDALITESAVPTPSTSSRSTGSRSNRPSAPYTVPAGDSYAGVVGSAPRVGVSAFHIGATTPAGERVEGVSGVHFSTPDRTVRCSTGNSGDRALACVSDAIHGRPAPGPGTPDGCTWQPDLVVLSADRVAAGACANLYPVLYRSHILEYGSTISAGDFSCLSDPDGLYCLESRSGKGFEITRTGYSEIHGDDRAPARLHGGTADVTRPSGAITPAPGTIPSR